MRKVEREGEEKGGKERGGKKRRREERAGGVNTKGKEGK